VRHRLRACQHELGPGRDGGADACQEAHEDGAAEQDGGEVDHGGVWCGVGEPVDGGGEYGACHQVDFAGQDNVCTPSPRQDGHREEEGVRI
jgi:hypothetical protein